MAARADAGVNARPSVIVFDVNETLLDIEVLTPFFAQLFGNGAAMREWFAQLILYSQTLTLAERYVPFATLGAGVLRMMADYRDIAVDDAAIATMRGVLTTMPAHPDVPDGLQRLRDAGFRLVTLTNSAPDPAVNPLERAGIAHFFERQFSVDAVRRFKPAPEVYRQVSEALAVESEALCLVAAHSWDTIGAQALNWEAALVTRPGNAILPLPDLPRPQVVGADLRIVADAIVARWC